jgi:hypothetical protein
MHLDRREASRLPADALGSVSEGAWASGWWTLLGHLRQADTKPVRSACSFPRSTRHLLECCVFLVVTLIAIVAPQCVPIQGLDISIHRARMPHRSKSTSSWYNPYLRTIGWRRLLSNYTTRVQARKAKQEHGATEGTSPCTTSQTER